MYIYVYIYVYIYIYKTRFLFLNDTYFGFFKTFEDSNVEFSKVWLKPKYSRLERNVLLLILTFL